MAESLQISRAPKPHQPGRQPLKKRLVVLAHTYSRQIQNVRPERTTRLPLKNLDILGNQKGNCISDILTSPTSDFHSFANQRLIATLPPNIEFIDVRFREMQYIIFDKHRELPLLSYLLDDMSSAAMECASPPGGSDRTRRRAGRSASRGKPSSAPAVMVLHRRTVSIRGLARATPIDALDSSKSMVQRLA